MKHPLMRTVSKELRGASRQGLIYVVTSKRTTTASWGLPLPRGTLDFNIISQLKDPAGDTNKLDVAHEANQLSGTAGPSVSTSSPRIPHQAWMRRLL